MSNETKQAELVAAVRDARAAVEQLDEAACAALGINRTDGRCLDVLDREGPLTAGRLAAASVEATGRSVELDEAVLREALDPAACAAARRQVGSSSQAAMGEMLDGLRATLIEHDAWGETALEHETAAETALLARARELA